MNLVDQAVLFFGSSIWNIKLSGEPKIKAFLINALRVGTLSIRFYLKNQCSLRASALTFYSLLSIVPIVALMCGIAKGLGFDEKLRQDLADNMSSHPEVAEKLLSFSDQMLLNAKSGVVAGLGVLLLIWTALKLLSSVECSFNDIWGIKHGRSIARKITDYLTMTILFPLLLILVNGFGAYAAAQVNGVATTLPFPETANFIIAILTRTIPFIAAWLIFSFIYILLPNTKVRLTAGLISGVFTGTLYLLLQSLYVYAQIILTSYNAVYGSFAALPFFMIWLQLTWMLVLAGAQLSFTIQNVSSYEFSPGEQNLSMHDKVVHSLRIMHELACAFEQHTLGLSDDFLSSKLELPVRTTRKLLYDLQEAGLITELMTEKDSFNCYQVALPTEKLTPTYIISSLAKTGNNSIISDGREFGHVVDSLLTAADHSSENKPIATL